MAAQGSSKVLGRVGVIGDVHCEDEVLSQLLEHFAGKKLDAVLCVGDLADGAGDINRTCRLLEQHGVHTVLGNHDRWLLAGELRDDPDATPPRVVSATTRAFLEKLPPKLAFETPAGKLLLCHGIDDDDMVAVKRDHLRYDLDHNAQLQRLLKQGRYAFMIGGHTHQTMVRRLKELTIINPGTLHRGYPQSAALVDFEMRELEFYDLSGGAIRVGETLVFPDEDELSSRTFRL
jgi:putative phosphoesterase